MSENGSNEKKKRGRPRIYNQVPIPPKPEFIREGEQVERALKELDIDLEKVRLAPKFTDLLMLAKDGLPGVLEAMRYSRNDLIEKFLEIYDAQEDKMKAIIPWEAWCIKGGIKVSQLLGEIILALREHSVNAVKILAITHHPDTVWTRIQQAKTPLGHRERQTMDIAMGFLPTPRGPTFIDRVYVGSKPEAEIGVPRKVESIAATVEAPPEPPPPPPPPPESHDPADMEIEEVFPDASRTLEILNG